MPFQQLVKGVNLVSVDIGVPFSSRTSICAPSVTEDKLNEIRNTTLYLDHGQCFNHRMSGYVKQTNQHLSDEIENVYYCDIYLVKCLVTILGRRLA